MSDHDDNHSSKHSKRGTHSATHGATTIRASKGGGGGKWLIGALAAVVLAGGGYAAYQYYGNGQSNTQTAYNDSYADESYNNDPLRAGPLESSDDMTAETASTDEAAPAAAPAQRSAARSTPRSSSTVVAQGDVPEETIGIMPVNAMVQDSEEIIVNPPRRPVWTRTPNPRRLSAFYPESDLNRGREGEARLSCTVVDGGALNCARASETSPGFGRAALRVARTYRHAPTLADGSDATGTPVNLRVMFRLADEDRRVGRG